MIYFREYRLKHLLEYLTFKVHFVHQLLDIFSVCFLIFAITLFLVSILSIYIQFLLCFRYG